MSVLGWVITLVAMTVGLGLVAFWIADVGGPVEPERQMCGAVHPVLGTVCVRGVDHEVIDVHQEATGQVWYDDEDPIRTCVDDTEWRGPWR